MQINRKTKTFEIYERISKLEHEYIYILLFKFTIGGNFMLLKTNMEAYLQEDNSFFSFNNVNYIVGKIDEQFKVVLFYLDILNGPYQPLGIYDTKRKGFVLALRDKQTCDYFQEINKNDSLNTKFEFCEKLKEAIESELQNAISFEAKRTEQNDKQNDTYKKLINRKAEECIINNTSYEKHIPINHTITEEEIFAALVDFDDTAYDIAEKILERNEAFSYQYFLTKDIEEKIEEFKTNTNNVLSAKSKIHEIYMDPTKKTFSVLISTTKDIITVKYNDLAYFPLELIEEIRWKKQVLYEKKNYVIPNEPMEYWINFNYRNLPNEIFSFIPKHFFDNEDFTLSLLSKGLPIDYIPQSLLQTKTFFLKLTSKIIAIDAYQKLNDTLKNDMDILKEMFHNQHFILPNIYPSFAYKSKEIVLDLIRNENITSINKMCSINPHCIDDSFVFMNLMDLLKTKTIPSFTKINDEILQRIQDEEIILKLIRNSNYAIYQQNNIHPIVLNNPVFWEKLTLLNKMNFNVKIVYDTLNHDSKQNADMLSNIFLCSNKSEEQTIINTIGLEKFKNWEELQKKCVEKKFTYLLIVSQFIFEEGIKDLCKKDVDDTLYILKCRNDSDISDKLLLELIELNHDLLYRLTSSYKSNLISIKMYKTLFDKNSNYINSINPRLFFLNEELKELASNYKSILPNVPIICTYNQDLVLKCLKHDVQDIKLVVLKSTNLHDSLFKSKEFIKNVFEIPMSNEDREYVVDYMLNNNVKLIKDTDILQQILSDDFTLLKLFKRPIYNNKELMIEVIKKTKTSKTDIQTVLEDIGSKLRKDKDILLLLK